MEWWTQDLALLGRTAAAMLLGGLVGLERELHRRPAGLRTHMLIAGAAALLVGLGDIIAERFVDERYSSLLRVDPVRLIEAIVACVGFVAAGTILRSDGRERVKGLTTAGSLVMAAAIGIACGLARYALAAGVAVLCLLVLAVLGRLERRLSPSDRAHGE